MIPRAYILEWSGHVPWQSYAQVEQDLVICRTLVEIFSDDWLASSVAFRGGTALHKLYLQPQPRYSEDIDLVQIRAEPIKETVRRLQAALEFIGESTVKPRKDGVQILCRFDSELPPSIRLRLKVETNTREHLSVYGPVSMPFQVQSRWFYGDCQIPTYRLEELLGTKLRALYQRKKGRDLYDLFAALQYMPNLSIEHVIHSYREYMKFSVGKLPTRRDYLMNMEAKLKDDQFIGDTTALLRPRISYKPEEAYELIKEKLIVHL